MNITYRESGGITSAWVRLEGRSAVCLGESDLPVAELAARAERYWQHEDAQAAAEQQLRARHPGRQVYGSWLPEADVDLPPGQQPGHYLYVLCDRRRRGKHQVLDLIA